MSSGSYKDFSNVVHIRSSAIKAFYMFVFNILCIKWSDVKVCKWTNIQLSSYKTFNLKNSIFFNHLYHWKDELSTQD